LAIGGTGRDVCAPSGTANTRTRHKNRLVMITSGCLGALDRYLDAFEVRVRSSFGMQAAALEALFALGILLLLAFLLFSALLEIVVGFLGQCRLRNEFAGVVAEWPQWDPGGEEG